MINITASLNSRIAMLTSQLATTADPTKRADIQSMLDGCKASLAAQRTAKTYCHYCGLPTRNGECSECGTEPF